MSSLVNKAESRTKWHQSKYLRTWNTAFHFTPILSELAKTNSKHLWTYILLKSCLFNVKIFSLIFFIELLPKSATHWENWIFLFKYWSTIALFDMTKIPSQKIRNHKSKELNLVYDQTEIIKTELFSAVVGGKKKRRNPDIKSVSQFFKSIFFFSYW